MRIGIFGAGDARDHALFNRLVADGKKENVFAFIQGGNALLLENSHCCQVSGVSEATREANDLGLDAIIISHPLLLIGGAADKFEQIGIPVWGPKSDSARIEGSKWFTKQMLLAASIPTPATRFFPSADEATSFFDGSNAHIPSRFVAKSDRFLANAHYRTIVPENHTEAIVGMKGQALSIAAEVPGGGVLLEERVEGYELSLHVLWDGQTYCLLPPVQDQKRAFDGNQGPNTHGVGAIAIGPGYDKNLEAKLLRSIVEPILLSIQSAGLEYTGILYVGVMVTRDGPVVLEINVRGGNPEVIALLPLLDISLLDVIELSLRGKLADCKWSIRRDLISGVVFATSAGYPIVERAYGEPVTIEVDANDRPNLLGEGISRAGDGYIASGGRVLAAAQTGKSASEVRSRINRLMGDINFRGMYWRSDLGADADRHLFHPDGAARLKSP
jgi:phosphoribosylamine---glycine ligase